MENKIVLGKEKKKGTTDFDNETVVTEIGENALVTVGTKDLNEKDEEEDFSLKDLNEEELDEFYHANTLTFYELVKTISGKIYH